MAVSLPQYQNPEDIKEYGAMVNGFSQAAKSLAGLKREIEALRNTVSQAVGEGRYNSQSEPFYIIYGPKKTEAARHNNTGLFGGFFYVHLPELYLSLYGPKLLGKAGCQLRVTIDGEAVFFPLHNLVFNYIPDKRYPNAPAQVIIEEDHGPLKAGTTIMLGRHWIKEGQTALFDIVDATGKSLQERTAALMLWSHLTAQGFKKHGRDSARYQTLEAREVNGVDDDLAAERFMVEWLVSIKKYNGIDLMPAFNDYVYKSHLALSQNVEFLEALTQGLAIARDLREALQVYTLLKGNPLHGPHEIAYHNISSATNTIENGLTEAVARLGLPVTGIPLTDYNAPIADAVANLTRQINTKRLAKMWRDHSLYIIQNIGPFSPDWVHGTGNVERPGRKSEIDMSIESSFWPAMWSRVQAKLQNAMLERVHTRLGRFATRLNRTIYNLQRLSGTENEIKACEDARLSVLSIKKKLERPSDIGILSEEIAVIRRAYDLAKDSHSIIKAAAHAEVAQKPNLTEKKIRKAVNTKTRASQRNTLKLFEGLKQFLDFMDAIGCDGDKWIKLYGLCSALEPQARASEPAADLRSVLAVEYARAKPALMQGAAL